MYPIFVIGLIGLALVSCKPKEEPVTAPAETKLEHPSDWTPAEPGLQAGKIIYQSECSLCHDEGEEGAPKLSNKKQWDTRSEKGLPTLIKHAIEGFNGEDGEMPARGGTETLTDEEVSNAVKFMIAAPK